MFESKNLLHMDRDGRFYIQLYVNRFSDTEFKIHSVTESQPLSMLSYLKLYVVRVTCSFMDKKPDEAFVKGIIGGLYDILGDINFRTKANYNISLAEKLKLIEFISDVQVKLSSIKSPAAQANTKALSLFQGNKKQNIVAIKILNLLKLLLLWNERDINVHFSVFGYLIDTLAPIVQGLEVQEGSQDISTAKANIAKLLFNDDQKKCDDKVALKQEYIAFLRKHHSDRMAQSGDNENKEQREEQVKQLTRDYKIVSEGEDITIDGFISEIISSVYVDALKNDSITKHLSFASNPYEVTDTQINKCIEAAKQRHSVIQPVNMLDTLYKCVKISIPIISVGTWNLVPEGKSCLYMKDILEVYSSYQFSAVTSVFGAAAMILCSGLALMPSQLSYFKEGREGELIKDALDLTNVLCNFFMSTISSSLLAQGFISTLKGGQSYKILATSQFYREAFDVCPNIIKICCALKVLSVASKWVADQYYDYKIQDEIVRAV